MRYVASYLLAALGGNASPSAKDIKKILDSVGIEADDDRLNKVISELNGKNIEDVIAQGEIVCWGVSFSWSILIPAGQPVACQVSLVDQSTREASPREVSRLQWACAGDASRHSAWEGSRGCWCCHPAGCPPHLQGSGLGIISIFKYIF
uniref:Large ribosomal subunit protein P2 n=1 Tax=Lynx canadensis TaxID=61383 RepID=A0A667HBW1_LYNCA